MTLLISFIRPFLDVSRYALWMAPELLRILPLRQYTQPGDVYSFAIIMYEMCTRKQPYVTEMSYISVAGNG